MDVYLLGLHLMGVHLIVHLVGVYLMGMYLMDVHLMNMYCNGVGARGQQQQRGGNRPEEQDWERMLDCLSLGLCHLFK
jgi:hypothetical protein